jgi:hypothetical protein
MDLVVIGSDSLGGFEQGTLVIKCARNGFWSGQLHCGSSSRMSSSVSSRVSSRVSGRS